MYWIFINLHKHNFVKNLKAILPLVPAVTCWWQISGWRLPIAFPPILFVVESLPLGRTWWHLVIFIPTGNLAPALLHKSWTILPKHFQGLWLLFWRECGMRVVCLASLMESSGRNVCEFGMLEASLLTRRWAAPSAWEQPVCCLFYTDFIKVTQGRGGRASFGSLFSWKPAVFSGKNTRKVFPRRGSSLTGGFGARIS